jgi:hypothetical protein
MKAVFSVVITNPEGGIRSVCKEKEIGFVPVAGMQVEDSAWDNPVDIVSVCYGIESTGLSVTLMLNAKNSQEQKSLLQMHMDHGWKIP